MQIHVQHPRKHGKLSALLNSFALCFQSVLLVDKITDIRNEMGTGYLGIKICKYLVSS